jgi:RNA recognition motif-containing protein
MATAVESSVGDLSFDLLFSGDQNSPRNVPPSKEDKGNGDLFQDGADYADENLSTSAPQSSGRRRTRTRKRTTTFCKSDKDLTVDKEKLCLFVYSCNGKKLNWPTIIAALDEGVAESREYYFKENHMFGFIQFQKPESVSKAIEILANSEIDGVHLDAERCLRASPGKDPKDPSDAILVTNNILVIKNLPYNMKEEKLLNILNAFEDQRPEDVSFHHDSSGTFRGMVFVKYSSVQDAVFVYEHINNIDVGGRPIKIEYKRKPDPTDEEYQKLQQQLQHFKENDVMTDLAFPFSLSNSQRKQIHSIAEKLDLRFQSFGENENRYIIVSKKREDPEPSKNTQIPKRKQSGPQKVATSWNDRDRANPRFGSSWNDKQTSSGFGASPPEKNESRKRSYSKGSTKVTGGWSSSVGQTKDAKESFLVYVPKREPKGPDGTNGFSTEYQKAREILLSRRCDEVKR